MQYCLGDSPGWVIKNKIPTFSLHSCHWLKIMEGKSCVGGCVEIPETGSEVDRVLF